MRIYLIVSLIIGMSSFQYASNWSPEMLSKFKSFQIDVNRLIPFEEKEKMELKTDYVEIELDTSFLRAIGNNEITSEYGMIFTDLVQIDYDNFEISFIGNVKLNYQEMSLNSKKAYVKVNEDILIANDDVKFVFDTYKASANNAEFNRNSNQILFQDL